MKFRYCYKCGSKVEIKKDLERNRAFCPKCQEFLYENPIPSVAAVVTDQENRILLIKRRHEPGKGKWCLPGGFVEIGETPEEAIQRELMEETGIEIKEPVLLGVGTHLNGYYGDVIIIAYTAKAVTNSPIPSDDAEEAGFFSLEERPTLIFPVHEEFIDLWKRKIK